MIHFIKFILSSANGVKIADILLNLKVPSEKDLKEITKKFEDVKETKQTLYSETIGLISQILTSEVSR